MRTKRDGERLTAVIKGELDHASAEGIRNELEQLLADRSVTELVLDVSGLTFMDSSGIGVVIGRYRTLQKRNGTMRVVGAKGKIDQLFEMAGIYRIVGKG